MPLEPFVSPDSRWVGFNDEASNTLRKMPLTGGPPVSIADVGREILGATWGPDDTIVFATTEVGTGLWRVPAGGGKPAALTTPDKARGEVLHAWPEFLPGGKAILFTIRSGERSDDFQIAVLNLETGETKTLVRGGSSPRFSPSGHLVYGIENSVRAVPFDPVRLEVLGDPIPLLDGVITKVSGGGDFSRTQGGFVAGVPRVTVDGGFYYNPGQNRSYGISRDGNRFLLIETPNTGSQADTVGLTVVLNWAEDLKRLAPLAPNR